MLPIAILGLGWILSICTHEFGHAAVAYWGGDRGVKHKGYLTFNPIQYSNPVVSLLLPIAFVLLSGIPLTGFTVYVKQCQLRGRCWKSAVAVAGPLITLLLAILLAAPFWLHWVQPESNSLLWAIVACLIFLNIYLGLLSLLPIPLLDGYGVIEPWLPTLIQIRIRKQNWFVFLVLLCFLWSIPQIRSLLINPSLNIAKRLDIPQVLIEQGYAFLGQKPLIFTLLLTLGILIFYRILRILRYPCDLMDVLGFGLLLCRQYEKALACFDHVIHHQPNNYTGWLNRGNALSNLHRYLEAIASYDEAIRHKPDYYSPLFRQGTHQAWLNRGNALQHLQSYEAAIASYDQALQLRSEDEIVWYNKALALSHWASERESMSERLELALFAYERAIQLKPGYYQALYNQGVILSQLGNQQAALLSFENVLKLKPRFAPAWLNRGAVLTDLQQFQEALRSFQRATQLQPTSYLNWYSLGTGLKQAGRYSEAIAAFNRALQLQPDHANSWYQKACCCGLQAQNEQAFEFLETAFYHRPDLRQCAQADASFDAIRDQL